MYGTELNLIIWLSLLKPVIIVGDAAPCWEDVTGLKDETEEISQESVEAGRPNNEKIMVKIRVIWVFILGCTHTKKRLFYQYKISGKIVNTVLSRSLTHKRIHAHKYNYVLRASDIGVRAWCVIVLAQNKK